MLLALLLLVGCVDDVRTNYTITLGTNPTATLDIPTQSSWDQGEDEPGIVEQGWCEVMDPVTTQTEKFQLLLEVEYDPTESWDLLVSCKLDAYIAVYSDTFKYSPIVADEENCETTDSRWACYSFIYDGNVED